MNMLFHILFFVAGALAKDVYLIGNLINGTYKSKAWVPNGQDQVKIHVESGIAQNQQWVLLKNANKSLTQVTTYIGDGHTPNQQWTFLKQDSPPEFARYPPDGDYFFLNIGAGKFADVGENGKIVVSDDPKTPFYFHFDTGKSVHLILQQVNGSVGWSTSSTSPEVVLGKVGSPNTFAFWYPQKSCV